MSFIIVFGGGVLLALSKKENCILYLKWQTKGLVYLGKLGWLIGVILILNDLYFSNKAILPKLWPLLALPMLPFLYDYLGRTICRFREK
tara:strand:- start:230 stop:496 length:267 start_codon:yes stop_codon:yes gene_type:complete